MSLISNIGIGKEYFNPFSFLKCQEEGFTSIAEAYDWFSQMQDRNLIPNTAEVTLDITLWRYNLLDVRLRPDQKQWLCFNFNDNSVRACQEAKKAIAHLKELYPKAFLVDDNNILNCIYKGDFEFYVGDLYLFYPGRTYDKLQYDEFSE